MCYLKSKCSTIIPALIFSLTLDVPATSNDNEVIGLKDLGVTFAFFSREGLVCYPEFLVETWQFDEALPDSIKYILGEAEGSLNEIFVPIADSLLNGYITDRPGDTISVLWSDGISRAVIEKIGGICEACQIDFVCLLNVIDPLPDPPARDHSFIVLRQDKNHIQQPIPFNEINYPQAAHDSLTSALATYADDNSHKFKYLWMDLVLAGAPGEIKKKRIIDDYEENWDEIPYFPENPILRIYKAENDAQSDSVWLLATDIRDFGQVLLLKAKISNNYPEFGENIYATRKVMSSDVRLDFMIDLFEDGSNQILLQKGVSREIIELKSGIFSKMVESDIRACP